MRYIGRTDEQSTKILVALPYFKKECQVILEILDKFFEKTTYGPVDFSVKMYYTESDTNDLNRAGRSGGDFPRKRAWEIADGSAKRIPQKRFILKYSPKARQGSVTKEDKQIQNIKGGKRDEKTDHQHPAGPLHGTGIAAACGSRICMGGSNLDRRHTRQHEHEYDELRLGILPRVQHSGTQ